MARRSGWSNAAYVTVQQAKRAGAEALNVLASPIFHALRLDIFMGESVRPTASSLSEARRRGTWQCGMPSRRAITLFDAPSANSARTSSSRGVSGTSPSADGETSVEMRRASG